MSDIGQDQARGAAEAYVKDRYGDGETPVGLEGNVARVLPELVRRNVTPDLVTDQTSAHDPLNGYVPAGLSLEAAAELRRTNTDEYVERAMESMSRHVEAMLTLQRNGAIDVQPGAPEGGNIRSQLAEANNVVSMRARWRNPQELLVTLDIHEGFHINSSEPPKQSNLPLIPTRISIDGEADAEIIYPPARQQQFAHAEAAPDRPFQAQDAPLHRAEAAQLVQPVRHGDQRDHAAAQHR